MQIIKSYSTSGKVSRKQLFKLFHLARPSVLQWRQTRFGSHYEFDDIDIWIKDNIHTKNITVVDFAGWYLEELGFCTTCIESDPIAKIYWDRCFIEPSLIANRPDYISKSDPVIIRHPTSLRYTTLSEFVNFLKLWVKSLTILNFNPRMIQFNYLKFELIDLVKQETDLKINVIQNNLWKIEPNG